MHPKRNIQFSVLDNGFSMQFVLYPFGAKMCPKERKRGRQRYKAYAMYYF